MEVYALGISWQTILGGLGLFLFGIQYMGDGLKSVSGDKLRTLIDRYTSSPLKGILIGALVTCLIQSSSGTTALTIGLIRSGLMNMDQAVGIIMGANIGTTITAVLVGLKISKYALYFIIAGAVLIMFSSVKKRQYLGQILFGFGCLFYGLELMSQELGQLSCIPQFSNLTSYMAQNPLFSLLGGILITIILQSSSAVIAIIQEMYAASAISLSAALPFLFGSNIGTTITAVLASLGGSTASKRAAAFHVIFNVTGAFFFMLLLSPFIMILNFLIDTLQLSDQMQLAIAHGIFNIVTTLLMYPFISYFTNWINRIIRSKKSEFAVSFHELDEQIVRLFPSHALEIARHKASEMGPLLIRALAHCQQLITSKDHHDYEMVEEIEQAINTIDLKITSYLQLIVHEKMNDTDARDYMAIMKSIKDYERIGDLCINVIEMCDSVFAAKATFSQAAKNELFAMIEVNRYMIEQATMAFKNQDHNAKRMVLEKEEDLDRLNQNAKESHIARVAAHKETSAVIISTYVDILAQLERMGDHCVNISQSMAENK